MLLFILFSADGFVETVNGHVIEGATVELLSSLDINPNLFGDGVCNIPHTNETVRCTYLSYLIKALIEIQCFL